MYLDKINDTFLVSFKLHYGNEDDSECKGESRNPSFDVNASKFGIKQHNFTLMFYWSQNNVEYNTDMCKTYSKQKLHQLLVKGEDKRHHTTPVRTRPTDLNNVTRKRNTKT